MRVNSLSSSTMFTQNQTVWTQSSVSPVTPVRTPATFSLFKSGEETTTFVFVSLKNLGDDSISIFLRFFFQYFWSEEGLSTY